MLLHGHDWISTVERINSSVKKKETERITKLITLRKILIKLKSSFIGCDNLYTSLDKEKQNSFSKIEYLISHYFSHVDFYKYKSMQKDFCICDIIFLPFRDIIEMLKNISILDNEKYEYFYGLIFFIYPNFFNGIYRVSFGCSCEFRNKFVSNEEIIISQSKKVHNLLEYKDFEKNLDVKGFGGTIFNVPEYNFKFIGLNKNKDSDNNLQDDDDDDFIILDDDDN